MRSNCPITCALDLIGDPWTLVVLRDVILRGARSFGEMAVAEGIATNTLSDRLRRLEAGGVLDARRDPADGRRRIYTPTERGLDLIPVLLDLLVWGHAHRPDGTAKSDLVAQVRADREGVIAAIRAAAAQAE